MASFPVTQVILVVRGLQYRDSSALTNWQILAVVKIEERNRIPKESPAEHWQSFASEVYPVKYGNYKRLVSMPIVSASRGQHVLSLLGFPDQLSIAIAARIQLLNTAVAIP